MVQSYSWLLAKLRATLKSQTPLIIINLVSNIAQYFPGYLYAYCVGFLSSVLATRELYVTQDPACKALQKTHPKVDKLKQRCFSTSHLCNHTKHNGIALDLPPFCAPSAIVSPDAVMRDDHRIRSPHRGRAESRERDYQGRPDGYNRSRQGKP